MLVKKRVKLGNNEYYVIVDLKYCLDEDKRTILCLRNYDDSYYDNGNFSLLLDKVSQMYNQYNRNSYDKYISFMDDILYIYDRVPFLYGISEENKDDSSIIYKSEIDDYIIDNNIVMNNYKIKLVDGTTWNF